MSFALVTLIVIGLVQWAQAQVLEVLHSFSGPDGAYPSAGLVEGSGGRLYGTTVYGGASGAGAVFCTKSSEGVTLLASFNRTNGYRPYAGLIFGSDGHLYGATAYGGPTNMDNWLGHGTLFKVTTNGDLTTLIFFDDANGSNPYSELVLGSDGNFYGTTDDCCGSSGGIGTIFKMSPAGGLTTLVFFTYIRDGAVPIGPLIEGADGAFYGITLGGGPPNPAHVNCQYGCGTVFKATTNGVLTTLAAFDGASGERPVSMILADDGNFYGTTLDPWPGTVFKMTADGTLSVLLWFNGWNGDYPEGGLVQAKDHWLYGTTRYGGAYASGNVFRVSTNGAVQNLISFDGTNGLSPNSRLIQASDGNLYGTTYAGGANNLGTVFRIVFPTLSAIRVGDQLTLSWPTNQLGFTLQISENVSPANWVESMFSPVVAGDRFWVTNPISAGPQFFRLKK